MRKHYYKYTKQFGLTILEALISTAIVGIGFVAILQMVNFSVQSVDSSGERTKANFFVSMLAEDVISHRYTIDGRNENDLAEDLSTNPWRSEGDESRICARQRATTDTALTDAPADIYGDQVDSDTSIDNKKNKWQRIFKDDQFLKCKSDRDVKRMKVFKICRWGAPMCDFDNPLVYDEPMYIGRIQINMNDGKKRKYLYFQADYKIMGHYQALALGGDDGG